MESHIYFSSDSEPNKIAYEDNLSDISDHILNDNIVNYGSKLLKRDENDGNYRITQEIPRNN
ncbi:hypothetical protein H5410_022781 [Solanum commersonii]|uniref:Uncharacterized protein n=1 Tax=Solanum commersonii TaxID=4109 RepID=A0A9J5ZIM7_SOLCO|nr:hypothetical protein H5410_022781 [Solanum commersonii]